MYLESYLKIYLLRKRNRWSASSFRAAPGLCLAGIGQRRGPRPEARRSLVTFTKQSATASETRTHGPHCAKLSGLPRPPQAWPRPQRTSTLYPNSK